MVFAEFDAYRGTSSSHRRTPDAMAMTSVPEWDRQFRLVRVHHEHREELGRLRLAGIGADAGQRRCRPTENRPELKIPIDFVVDLDQFSHFLERAEVVPIGTWDASSIDCHVV